MEYKHDSKSLLKTLKTMGLPSKKSESSKSVGLKINDEICFDPLKVAEKFNTFFSTVASSLIEKLPNCSGTFGKSFVREYYQKLGACKNAFGFSLVSEEKVLKYLFKLGANKATGLDGIPSRFIIDSAGIVTVPIALTMNLSIVTGVMPNDLKSACVVPLFKKNDNTETGNYRPVSVLNTESEVLERVGYDQFESYMLQNKLISEYQSGFRRGFSTSTCLTHLSDHTRFQILLGWYFWIYKRPLIRWTMEFF